MHLSLALLTSRKGRVGKRDRTLAPDLEFLLGGGGWGGKLDPPVTMEVREKNLFFFFTTLGLELSDTKVYEP